MISFFRGSPGLAEGRPRLARVDRVSFLDSRGKSQSMADCLGAAFPGFGQAVRWSRPDLTGRTRRVERPRRTIAPKRPDHNLPGRSVKPIMVDVSKIDIDLLGPGPPAAGGPVARQVRFHHPFAAL
jgi:hypothetical protein